VVGPVDTNFHVVAPPSQRRRYPLDPLPGTAAEFAEDQSTTARECLDLMDSAGVAQAYLIASRFHGFDNSYCADSAAQHPTRFVAIANVDILAPDAPDRVDHWIGARGMHGVRFWGGGRGTASWIDDAALRPAWERVRAYGVPANAQTTTPEAFAATRRFLERFGDVPLTVNHLGHVPVAAGGGSPALAELLSLAEFPEVRVNFPVELAVAVTRGERQAREVLDALLARFGPRRLMWSAFYPSRQERPYAESVRLLREALAFLPPPDRDWILGGTARDLYPVLRR